MAGFLLALAGGAAKGLGTGWMAEAAANREEKLSMLDREFQREQGEASRAVQREQIAATKENAAATLALQRDLGVRGLELDEERLAQTGDIAREQIEAQKELTQLQIDATADLNTTFQQQADGTFVMMRGGKPTKMGLNPENGKPLDPLINSNDTPAITNYKFLLTVGGATEAEARDLAFNSADNNEDEMYKSFQSNNTKAVMGDFSAGNPTPEQTEQINKMTDLNMANWRASKTGGRAETAATEPAAAEPAAATEPAAPAATNTVRTSTSPPRPPGVSDEVLIRQAKESVAAGTLTRQAALKRLKDWQVDPAKLDSE